MRAAVEILVFLSVIVAALADPIPSAANKRITEDLFKGTVTLGNQVTLKGEQYFQNDQGDQKGFAYYGYKYGLAGRFEVIFLNKFYDLKCQAF